MSRLLQVISYPSSLPRLKTCIHEVVDTHIIKEVRVDTRPVLSGLDGELLHLIADALGVSLEYHVDEDGWPSHFPENKSEMDGCLGMVTRGEVDFSIAQLAQIEDLTKYATSTYPYLYLTIRFITKLPVYAPKPFAFVKPFTPSTWISILLLLLLISFVFYFIQNKKLAYSRQVFNRFAEIISQSVYRMDSNHPNILPEKILYGFWIVGAHIVALFYMGVILNFMIAPKREPPLDTNEKLLKAVRRGDYKVGTPTELPFLLFMQQSTNPTVNELAVHVIQNEWEVSMSRETFVKLLEDDFALAATDIEFQLFTKRGFPVIISKDIISNCNIAGFISKNFTLREKLDIVILRINEAGIYTKILDHFFSRLHLSDETYSSEEKAIKPLTLSDLEGVFLLLGFGILSSALLLVVEAFISKSHCAIKNEIKAEASI